MKQILQRLFGDERLTSDQTRAIMYEITRQSYPDAQIAAMLTVFAMRGITVDELLGFREALMDAARRIDLSEYAPSTSSARAVTAKTHSTSRPVHALS